MLMWILLIITAIVLFAILSRRREKGDEEVVLPSKEKEDMEFGEEPLAVDIEGGSELESLGRDDKIKDQLTDRDTKSEIQDIDSKDQISKALEVSRETEDKMEVGYEIEPEFELSNASGRIKVLEISTDEEEKKSIINVGSKQEKQVFGHDMPINMDLTPRLIALAKDPNWIYVYWNLPSSVPEGNWELKVINLSQQSNYYQAIDKEIGNWYLNLKRPDQEFAFELGVWDESGNFKVILSSNSVRTPADRPSDIIDTEWATIEELYHFTPGQKQQRAGGSPEFIEEFGGASEQLIKY